MTRILFLDDNKERHDAFKKHLNDRAFKEGLQFRPVYVYTAKDAILALQYKRFDEIWLDHDLGGEIFVTRTEETGYEVALFIEKMYFDNGREPMQSTVIIHSFNPAGARRMMQALSGKVRAIVVKPFDIKVKEK